VSRSPDGGRRDGDRRDRGDGDRRRSRVRGSMVPEAEFRSYYGRPILKEPVWTWEVPWYLFAGGLAGASSSLGLGARLSGNERLARAAFTVAGAGAAVGVPLLASDLGRPERFLYMLRMFKVTSPLSVGSWILAAMGPTAVGAVVSDRLGIFPRLGRVAEVAAGLLGPALATYTGALFADTAVPVWHEAGRELPFVFAGSAAASAGAAAVLLTPPADAGPARRLVLSGALLELGAGQAMERRLGELGEPYQQGPAGRLARLAKACTAAGAGLVAVGGRRRRGLAAAGAALVLAGSACERWAVYKAGFQSARDPKYVVGPQRARLAARTAEQIEQ
jgi:Polysulphide reductase, NrfD